jgi:hypothetical protein
MRHNFKGTSDLDNLRQGETSTTVMDYPVYLLAPDGPGPYDEATIAYGYADKPAESLGKFAYGTDDLKDVDPEANTFDVGDALAFYTARVAYYVKLRSSPETFPTPEVYLAGMTQTLTHLRRFVNASTAERSAKAFEQILAIAAAPAQEATPPAPPTPLSVLSALYTKVDRLIAFSALTSKAPDGESTKAYRPLTGDQVAKVAAVLGKVLSDAAGREPIDLRKAALKGLVDLKDVRAYQVLEAAAKEMAPLASAPASSDEQVAKKELAILVAKAVASYY